MKSQRKQPRDPGVDPTELQPKPKKRRRTRLLRRSIPELAKNQPAGSVASTSGAVVEGPESVRPVVRKRKRKRVSLSENTPPSRRVAPPSGRAAVTISSKTQDIRRHVGILRHAPYSKGGDTSTTFEDTWKSLPTAKVVGVRIGLMSNEEIRKEGGNREVTSHSYGDKSKNDTIYDTRMGPNSLTMKCVTCSTFGCVGHFGIIDLKKPCFAPLQIKNLVLILRCICSSCGKLLMSKKEVFQKKLNLLPCFSRIKLMSTICVGRACTGDPDIPCETNPSYSVKDSKISGEIACVYNGTVFSMSVQNIKDKLNAISKRDAELMGFTNGNHPVDLVTDVVPVLPNNCKAPYYDGLYLRHTHIANQLKELVKLVNEQQFNKVYQTICSMICKSPANAVENSDQATAMDQLQGKPALVRGNSLGKPGNQHMRSVSGPDSAIKFGQVRFPRENIMLVTKSMVVTERNLSLTKSLCKKNMLMHYINEGSSVRRRIHPKYRPVIGDTVHRILLNGDTVLLNRQPTLHKGSVLAVDALIGSQLTIGLHMAYTTPMNADFDGDENNIYNLHCLMAIAEARLLQSPMHNFISVSSQAPMYGLVINGVTAAYMMSKDNSRVSERLLKTLVSLLDTDNDSRWEKVRTKMSAMGLNSKTTRGVLSMLYPEDFYYCRNKVQIVEGIHVSGSLTKSTVGNKSHSLLHEIYLKYGPERASLFVTEATVILDEWLCEEGFSIDLTDFLCMNYGEDGTLHDPYTEMMEKVYWEMKSKLMKLHSDTEMPQRIKNMEINSTLNVTKQVGLELAKTYQSKDNPLHIMGELGANTKGDVMKNCQMMCTIGQQYLSGEPLPAKLSNNTRLLPSMDINDSDPVARGYIKESFYRGVTGAGLFFSHQAGREGLLNTSIQTAKYGEMHRRMVRGYCNVVLDNDYSLRMGKQILLSPVFNLGTSIESNVSVNVEGVRITAPLDLKQMALDLNGSRGWITEESDRVLRKHSVKRIGSISSLQKIPSKVADMEYYGVGGVLPYKVTSFEKAKMVGLRAEQIQHSVPLLFNEGAGFESKWDGIDPVSVAQREMQLNLFNMKIKRVLPNGETLVIDPSENIAFNYKYPTENWMDDYVRINYNRVLPNIVEDLPLPKRKERRENKQMPTDFISRISEFAQTEGLVDEDSEMADVASQLSVAGEVPPGSASASVAPSVTLASAAGSSSSLDARYVGGMVARVTPAKESFLDAETFYSSVPQESPENNTAVLKMVRFANNTGKRTLIKVALSQFDKGVTVMDACCGKGGDLAKWGTKVDELYGVDMSLTLLAEMRIRWEVNRDRYPKALHTCALDLRIAHPVEMFSKYDIVSCMLGLNYMNQAKGELHNCMTNLCAALKEKAVVVLLYANSSAVREFTNTDNCKVTPVNREDWSMGYNFRLGALVNAVEYEVDSDVIDATMLANDLILVERQSMLPFLGTSVNWGNWASGIPLSEAMVICNLYVMELWIRDPDPSIL